jgi:predicted nucleotidyltransferase
VFAELAGLIRKSVGLAFPLQQALTPLADKISLAFVYGSVARGEEHAVSDIDLMVVAEGLDYPTLYEALQTAEAALGRTIHPNLMSVAEWQRKRGEADSFAARIASQPRLMLIGGDDVD